MAKHSTLTDPTDLHYAKVRSFTGDPTNVSPDFVDELVIATDTNRIYRATGIDSGQLIELVANSGSGVLVGLSSPTTNPEKEGEIFFNQTLAQLFVSVSNSLGVLWWKPLNYMENICSATISATTDDASINNSAEFSLWYTPFPPSEIESQAFEFSVAARTGLLVGAVDLSPDLNALGRGCYAIGYSFPAPEGVSLLVQASASGVVPDGFELRTSPYVVSANGVQITSYFFFSGQSLGNLDLIVNLVSVSIEL